MIHLRHRSPHHWIGYQLGKRFIKDFESNPQVQYRIHMTMSYVWLANFLLALGVFVFAQPLWQAVSVLYLVCISLYANFATDYGAVSAALAAGTAPAPAESAIPRIERRLALVMDHLGIEDPGD